MHDGSAGALPRGGAGAGRGWHRQEPPGPGGPGSGRRPGRGPRRGRRLALADRGLPAVSRGADPRPDRGRRPAGGAARRRPGRARVVGAGGGAAAAVSRMGGLAPGRAGTPGRRRRRPASADAGVRRAPRPPRHPGPGRRGHPLGGRGDPGVPALPDLAAAAAVQPGAHLPSGRGSRRLAAAAAVLPGADGHGDQPRAHRPGRPGGIGHHRAGGVDAGRRSGLGRVHLVPARVHRRGSARARGVRAAAARPR